MLKRLGLIFALCASLVYLSPAILWAASTFTGNIVVPNGSTFTFFGNNVVATTGLQFVLYSSTQALAVTTAPPQVVVDNAFLMNVVGSFNTPKIQGLHVYCSTVAVGATANTVDLYRGANGTGFAKIGSTLSWTTAQVANVTFTPVPLASDDVLQLKVTQIDGTAPIGCVISAEGTQLL